MKANPMRSHLRHKKDRKDYEDNKIKEGEGLMRVHPTDDILKDNNLNQNN